jgi:hypothetical protein
MNARLINVVIPTRDRNATLALCLDRLAPGAQTLPHDQYEVIVRRDDSAATSRSRLVRDRYPWARWEEDRDGAPREPQRRRARRARHLARLHRRRLPPRADLARGVRRAMSPNEEALDVLEGRTTCRAGLYSPRQTAPLNLDGGRLWSCNFAIWRAGFEKVGGFDERYPFAHMEDADLQFRLRKSGYMIHFVPAAEVDHPPRPLHAWRAARARARVSVLLVLHGPRRGCAGTSSASRGRGCASCAVISRSTPSARSRRFGRAVAHRAQLARLAPQGAVPHQRA